MNRANGGLSEIDRQVERLESARANELMEPRGIERHRWASRGRREREAASQHDVIRKRSGG